MPDLKFGKLELKTRYYKGADPGLDFALGYGRSTNTSERIFHYDCDTQTPTPGSLSPTREFGASLWCEPFLPMGYGTPFLLDDERRRELDRKSKECEQALLRKSGLTPAEFGQAMAPDFPKVEARIPVNAIRRMIPNYTFTVYLNVYWIHLACAPNITPFPCSTFIRFPFAYDFSFSFEKSCDGSKIPTFEAKKRYFELTELEKEFEREGVAYIAKLDEIFEKWADPPIPEPAPKPPEEQGGH